MVVKWRFHSLTHLILYKYKDVLSLCVYLLVYSSKIDTPICTKLEFISRGLLNAALSNSKAEGRLERRNSKRFSVSIIHKIIHKIATSKMCYLSLPVR